MHARRDHQRVAGNFISVRQFNYAIRTFCANAHRFLRRQDFHAEPLRLDHCAAREIAAAQSHWESQIIFDARTHSGLAAGSFAFNHHGVQALGGTIHGCRESRRAAAYNRQIVEIRLGPRLQTNALRDVRRYALEQFGPIRKKYDRQARSLWTKYLEQTFRFWIIGRGFDIDPLIGNTIARQEIAKFIGLGRPARSQNPDALEHGPIRSSPVIEQIIQLGIEMLARRIPRFQEEIIDARLIDRSNRSISVGIRSEQGPFGFGKNVHRFLQKRDAVHVRHALIGHQQGHAVVAQLQLLQKRKRAFGRIAANDAELRAIFGAQVAFDRTEYVGVVVNTE